MQLFYKFLQFTSDFTEFSCEKFADKIIFIQFQVDTLLLQVYGLKLYLEDLFRLLAILISIEFYEKWAKFT